MALRGVLQLARLTVRWCQHGGSSRGLRYARVRSELTHREYLATPELQKFKEINSSVEVAVAQRNGKHPLLIAKYKNGTTNAICVRNQSYEEVKKSIEYLRNRRSAHSKSFSSADDRHRTRRGSIQGPWHPDEFQHIQM